MDLVRKDWFKETADVAAIQDGIESEGRQRGYVSKR